MRFFIGTLFFVFYIFGLSICLNAQTPEAKIIVNIKNQLGEIVLDASLTLTKSDQTVGINNVIRQPSGAVQFSGLNPGEYQLTVAAPGFKEYKSNSFYLKKEETKRLEITLEIALVESSVVIGSDDEADSERYGATRTLTTEQIKNLPDDPGEIKRVLRVIAGNTVTGKEMPISVDGVQGSPIPPRQAIQQVRVNQNIFSAQYEGPNGGGIEIFTRSNIDKFNGSLSFNFADSSLNAADPFLGKRVPFQARSYFFNLGGPINKKSSFLLSINRNENDLSAIVNAIGLDPALEPVVLNETFSSPLRSENLSLTINSDISQKHKLSALYYVAFTRGEGQNIGGFTLPSRADLTNNQYHFFRISDTYLANQNVVSQTRFSADYTIYGNIGGSNALTVNVLDAFLGGGSNNDYLSKTLNFQLSNDTSWQIGKYGLGFGWRVRQQQINQVSRTDFGGSYTFSGRSAPVLDENNLPVIDANGRIQTTQISSLESYRRTLLFRALGYSNGQIRELGGGAGQFTISGGNPDIKANQIDYGFYVQNNYKLSQSFAASFGLRYENQNNIASKFDLAPRFGIIWSPKSNEKKSPLYSLPRISVGFGMFYSRFGLNNTLSIRQSNDSDRAQYLTITPNILDFYPDTPSVDLLQQFALARNSRFINSKFRTPINNLFNIDLNKKLPFGFSSNISFSYSKTIRLTLTRNINAPLAETFNPNDPLTSVYPLGKSGNVYEFQSTGQNINSRFAATLNFPEKLIIGNISYSFTKARNNFVFGSSSPVDAFDFSREFAPGTFDGVHTLTGYFSRKLPSQLLIEGDFSFRSGSRFNITTGRDTNGDGFFDERPGFADDLSRPGLVVTEYGVFDPNPASIINLIPRNLGRGPSRFVFNSGLSKTFGFGGDKSKKKPPRLTLRLTVTVRNVFNTVNRSNPIGNLSSPNFLRSLSISSPDGISNINGIQFNNFAGRSMIFRMGLSF